MDTFKRPRINPKLISLIALLCLIGFFDNTKTHAQQNSAGGERLEELAKEYPHFTRVYLQAFSTLVFLNRPDLLAATQTRRQAMQDLVKPNVDLCEAGLLPPRQPRFCPECDSEDGCGPVLEGQPLENPITCASCRESRRQCLLQARIGCPVENENNLIIIGAPQISNESNQNLREEWKKTVLYYPEFALAYADTLHSIHVLTTVKTKRTKLIEWVDQVSLDACAIGAIPLLSELQSECIECRSSDFDLSSPTEFQAYLACQGERGLCLLRAENALHCPG